MICVATPDAHCCVIEGQVCKFLDVFENRVRCSIWDSMNSAAWAQAPVGRWFAKHWPLYTCRDWPQNIPEVMATGIGLCCWQGAD